MENLKVKGTKRLGTALKHRRQLMAIATCTIMSLVLTTACGDDEGDNDIRIRVGWTVGTDDTILKTTDGGTNWISQNSGITNISFRGF